jgi:hypothetical protein
MKRELLISSLSLNENDISDVNVVYSKDSVCIIDFKIKDEKMESGKSDIEFVLLKTKGMNGTENYMDAIYKTSPYKNMDNLLPIVRTIDPSNPFCAGDKDKYINFCALSRCMSYGKFVDIN